MPVLASDPRKDGQAVEYQPFFFFNNFLD